MNSCESCQHWQRKNHGARNEPEAVGECRAGAPTRDFAWPRTKAKDFCSLYSVAAPGAFATKLAAIGCKPGDVVPIAPGGLILDAGKHSGASPAPAGDADHRPAARKRR